jgi:hypothetical protein
VAVLANLTSSVDAMLPRIILLSCSEAVDVYMIIVERSSVNFILAWTWTVAFALLVGFGWMIDLLVFVEALPLPLLLLCICICFRLFYFCIL